MRLATGLISDVNSLALCGTKTRSGQPYELADDAMKDGKTEIAKQYAKRCHQAILHSDNHKIKSDLLDLVLERWPEISG
jgi:hypothetical protein